MMPNPKKGSEREHNAQFIPHMKTIGKGCESEEQEEDQGKQILVYSIKRRTKRHIKGKMNRRINHYVRYLSEVYTTSIFSK